MFRMAMMAAIAAITLSSSTVHAQSAATPSLAEVARQTAAKRAAGKPATRVYTNASLAVAPEDVAPAAPAVAPAPAAATTVPATQAAAPAATATNDKTATDSISKDENHWRNQSATVRADLARARAALDKQKTGTPQYDQAQRSVSFFQKRWDALVESAKAANVPPEWLEARQQ